MEKIVECVPNFSEGRDENVIKQITGVIEEVEDVHLLDVDPGFETNRTVVTMVGSPEGVKEAAFRCIKKASEVIDMTKHKGAHPRMGATDVCPFIPVKGVSMEDCVAISKEVGKRVGEELGIPVYLYENSASKDEWQNLAKVRKGEYEGLKDRFGDPYWNPDYGEPKFNPKCGATAMGAREFLIAYNVNLNSKHKRWAKIISLNIKEKGRWVRDDEGNPVKDENGNVMFEPVKNTLDYVKAIGWVIPEYNRAQVSINLTNYKKTPLWKVFEACREEAREIGVRVTGSEVVGLVPLESILEVGRYYREKQDRTPGISEEDLITTAVQSMGLDELSDFDPNEKIIEYRIAQDRPLVSMTCHDFMNELASNSPAPGGGSVSAMAGAMGAGLTAMVAALTCDKRKFEGRYDEMWDVGKKAQDIKKALVNAVDDDTEAFNEVMAAARSKDKARIQRANKKAVEVPLRVCKLCHEMMDLAEAVVKKGNPASVSDGGVGALMAASACHGAWMNVKINLPSVDDKEWGQEKLQEATQYRDGCRQKSEEIVRMTEEKL